MRRVDDDDVHLLRDEGLRALEGVGADADRRTDLQPAALVLRRERVLDPLLDVLDGDQALEPPVGVHHGQLLDLVAVEDLLGLGERRPGRRGDEVAAGHQGRDRLGEVVLEAEVAVREDADEDLVLVDDRHSGDVVALHQPERVRDAVGGAEGDGLDDHPRLGALHLVDLGHLGLDREVAVHDPDPALAGERDREPGLGDRVHRGRHDRQLQRDRAGEPRRRRDVVREHRGLRRQQQDVVEGEALPDELLRPALGPLFHRQSALDVHQRLPSMHEAQARTSRLGSRFSVSGTDSQLDGNPTTARGRR